MTAETQLDEESAWTEVVGCWEDEAVHRGYLDRCGDLDALARAGGRYRDALAARPDDAVARRWRDEVVRRATAAGLAALPRDGAGLPRPPRWARPALLALLGLLTLTFGLLLLRSVTAWSRP